ncbi:MAG: hypothetical protein J6Y62_04145 [Clostridia bacterium]|nr:hypothetical protein [Clostridia bacterium]
MKKATKKVFAILLAMMMIISTVAVSAFAYTRNGREYTSMVLLGDSIGAGFSLPDYDRYGKYCLQNKRIEGSFGDLVAKKLKISSYKPYVSPGFRTKEIRVFLENDYEGDFVTQNFIGSLSGNENYNLEKMKSQRASMQKKIGNADIVMLEVGFNDTWLTVMGAYTDFSMTTNDPIGRVMNSPRYLYELQMGIQDTLFNFQQNFDPIIKDLYRLMKPGSTLVCVGVYNPFKDWTIPDGSMIYAGQLLNFLYNNMNSVMRSYAGDGVHDYVFVDVPNPEVISNTVNDMLSGVPALHKGGWDPHPTQAGHKYIANQILTALGA